MLLKRDSKIRLEFSPAAPGDASGVSATFETLCQRLRDKESEVRRLAALELASHKGASPVLVACLMAEQSATVRDAIFTSLASMKDPGAIPGLCECLRSENVSLRNGAIDALKLMPEQAVEWIPQLLADPNPDVRILTISILESLKSPEVEGWLVAVLERDTHVNVCGSALDVLAEVASVRSRDAIQAVRERFPSEAYIQFAVALALKNLKYG